MVIIVTISKLLQKNHNGQVLLQVGNSLFVQSGTAAQLKTQDVKLENTKQAQAMIKMFYQTIGKRKFTNWLRHLEAPYDSGGSQPVPIAKLMGIRFCEEQGVKVPLLTRLAAVC